ncbi:MAG: hypothetical protein ACYS47_15850 [Planctomycetota bacterium]|jgi:hypothetical protein
MRRKIHPLNIGSFPSPELVNAQPFREMRTSIYAMDRGERTFGLNGVLARWPSLAAHLMCTNGGAMTPQAAAGILRNYIEGREHWSEWGTPNVGARHSTFIRLAILYRRGHKESGGKYMDALSLVLQESVKS